MLAALVLTGCLKDEAKAPTPPVQTVQAASPEPDAPAASGSADPAAQESPIAEGLDATQQAARQAAMEAAQAVAATPADADPSLEAVAQAEEDEADLEAQTHETWTESEPPLTVELVADPLVPSLSMGYFRVRSRADRLEVRGITLNRGNCEMAETDKVITGINLPFALRFGAARRFRVQGCSRVIEATVDTQYGSYTFTW